MEYVVIIFVKIFYQNGKMLVGQIYMGEDEGHIEMTEMNIHEKYRKFRRELKYQITGKKSEDNQDDEKSKGR